MILGISILDDRLLLSAHYGPGREADYNTYLFGDSLADDPEPGAIWQLAGDQPRELFRQAEKSVLIVPASTGFLKRLELDASARSNSEYLSWLAQVELPDDPARFHYQFLPLRESFDNIRTEMLFFASPAAHIDRFLKALKIDDDSREIIILPEQLGLVKTLEKSLARDDIPQAGIVSCGKQSAVAVYVRDGRFNHGRFFKAGKNDDLATDIETYLLSRDDAGESLPLVIAGFPGDFKTGWSPVVPAFMGIHNLEFAGAWGAADYIFSESP